MKRNLANWGFDLVKNGNLTKTIYIASRYTSVGRNLGKIVFFEVDCMESITEGLKRTQSLRTLNRTLSLGILKRTLSMRGLKEWNQTLAPP